MHMYGSWHNDKVYSYVQICMDAGTSTFVVVLCFRSASPWTQYLVVLTSCKVALDLNSIPLDVHAPLTHLILCLHYQLSSFYVLVQLILMLELTTSWPFRSVSTMFGHFVC